jgi:hypothetical protein
LGGSLGFGVPPVENVGLPLPASLLNERTLLKLRRDHRFLPSAFGVVVSSYVLLAAPPPVCGLPTGSNPMKSPGCGTLTSARMIMNFFPGVG